MTRREKTRAGIAGVVLGLAFLAGTTFHGHGPPEEARTVIIDGRPFDVDLRLDISRTGYAFCRDWEAEGRACEWFREVAFPCIDFMQVTR